MFPGALIKFYLQALGPEGIISMSKKSPARLSCYIGVIKNGKIINPVEAIVEGKIANAFVDGGFGFGLEAQAPLRAAVPGGAVAGRWSPLD
jgi:inosine/xanthosine triphosphate pyrophosphatase family protein